MSHDSIFLSDEGQAPAEPGRIQSQENVQGKIKALQVSRPAAGGPVVGLWTIASTDPLAFRPGYPPPTLLLSSLMLN